MACCTFWASDPQTVSKFAGLGSVLTAASRQAGGVARMEDEKVKTLSRRRDFRDGIVAGMVRL